MNIHEFIHWKMFGLAIQLESTSNVSWFFSPNIHPSIYQKWVLQGGISYPQSSPKFTLQILVTSWWLNQPISKICSSNWIISPNLNRVKQKKIFELPRPRICYPFSWHHTEKRKVGGLGGTPGGMTFHWNSLSQWILEKKFERLIFPTKYVIPKSFKFGHWLSEEILVVFIDLYRDPKKIPWELKSTRLFIEWFFVFMRKDVVVLGRE